MNLQEQVIAKIQKMPDPLVQQVSDFINFLLIKHSNNHWEKWQEFQESLDLEEYDFSDYLSNLENEKIRHQKLMEEQAARDDFWAKRDAEKPK